jgi:hypothetical protein
MALTAHRVHIPSGQPVYNGTGKTLDEAIKDAHDKIPKHRQGHGLNKQTMELTPPKEGPANVPIRCKVVDIHYESGGITGLSTFQVRVIEG